MFFKPPRRLPNSAAALRRMLLRLKTSVRIAAILAVMGLLQVDAGRAAEPQQPSMARCQLIPQADRSVSMQVDGIERAAWHAMAAGAPRPFLFPLVGASGSSLTRMGHPGAPNHDHHRSIWFAHHDVNGLDFWSDQTDCRIRQQQWYAMVEGAKQCVLAVKLGWYDGTGNRLIAQDTIFALSPAEDGGLELEVQLELRAAGNHETIVLGQTNFGVLAVRVAKSLSVHFGGGQLTGSGGQKGEPQVFGQRARWVDYSGSNSSGQGTERKAVVEGITYFDHPSNPRYPTYWHVRDDGWMGASFCFAEPYTLQRNKPLRLRYLLVGHCGAYDTDRATAHHRRFANSAAWTLSRSDAPHLSWDVARAKQ